MTAGRNYAENRVMLDYSLKAKIGARQRGHLLARFSLARCKKAAFSRGFEALFGPVECSRKSGPSFELVLAP